MDEYETEHGRWLGHLWENLGEDKKAELYMWANEHWFLERVAQEQNFMGRGARGLLNAFGWEEGLSYNEARTRSWGQLALKPKVVLLGLFRVLGALNAKAQIDAERLLQIQQEDDLYENFPQLSRERSVSPGDDQFANRNLDADPHFGGRV